MTPTRDFRREYELMYLVRPDLGDDRLDAIQHKIEDVLEENPGTHERTERWSKRSLAYPIEGYEEGYYTVMRFVAGPELLDELDYTLRYEEDILRHLLTKVEEDKRRQQVEEEEAEPEEVEA